MSLPQITRFKQKSSGTKFVVLDTERGDLRICTCDNQGDAHVIADAMNTREMLFAEAKRRGL